MAVCSAISSPEVYSPCPIISSFTPPCQYISPTFWIHTTKNQITCTGCGFAISSSWVHGACSFFVFRSPFSVLRSPFSVFGKLPVRCWPYLALLSSFPETSPAAPVSSLSYEPDSGVVVVLAPALSAVDSVQRLYGSEPAHHNCASDDC
ncbi:hypothetical protein BDW72DRAFT_159819 [Aspergillus terricola var. indicus]